MRHLLAFPLALVFLAGCGGGDYKAPPKGNELEPAPNRTGQPDVPDDRTPTGPSYAKDYDPEARAALAAWKTWSRDRTPENFAKVGAHLYNAMRYKILTDRNGHRIDNLYKIREVGQLFTDWKKTTQLGDWENEEYKAAKAAYDEIQQSN